MGKKSANETIIHKVDTVYIVDTMKYKANEISTIDKYASLKSDIKLQLDNNFKNLYKHDTLNNDNYSFVLSEYQKAYNESLMLTETLSVKYKEIPSDDIGELVLKEIERKTCLFRSQVARYDKTNREKSLTKE